MFLNKLICVISEICNLENLCYVWFSIKRSAFGAGA